MGMGILLKETMSNPPIKQLVSSVCEEVEQRQVGYDERAYRFSSSDALKGGVQGRDFG
jgi:hypothetical protein